MADEQRSGTETNQKTVYQIRIRGHLDQQRMNWFEGLTISLEDDGNTLISGPIIDQSALHGILKKIRDLGMPLLDVNQVEPKHVEMKLSTNSTRQERSKRRRKK